jgi:membrane-bound lytic murein transglycosylase B
MSRRLPAFMGMLVLALVLVGGCASAPAHQRQDPAKQAFIRDMVANHSFQRGRLESLMAHARRRQSIIDAMERPAEAKPWYQYRSLFLGRKRIEEGARFMRDNRRYLRKARSRYGVPPAIITAILGVETQYGRNTGHIRVLDALTTLAFHYPPRHEFFTRELKQFLLLTRKQGIDPEQVKGSYAGAMGLPQFIASSYREYAVDFNGNGKVDLWREKADAIGSIANYLHRHGWRRGQPIAVRANVAPGVSTDKIDALHPNRLKADLAAAFLAQHGIRPQHSLPMGLKVGLLRLKGASASEYWLGAPDFYAITSYNHSALYAMAVYQLAQAIRREAQSHPVPEEKARAASASG